MFEKSPSIEHIDFTLDQELQPPLKRSYYSHWFPHSTQRSPALITVGGASEPFVTSQKLRVLQGSVETLSEPQKCERWTTQLNQVRDTCTQTHTRARHRAGSHSFTQRFVHLCSEWGCDGRWERLIQARTSAPRTCSARKPRLAFDLSHRVVILPAAPLPAPTYRVQRELFIVFFFFTIQQKCTGSKSSCLHIVNLTWRGLQATSMIGGAPFIAIPWQRHAY